MILGGGDIASALRDKKDVLFFASGVSNSQETREAEYRREVELLLDQDRTSHIVYFSSLSIFYADTRYTEHKRYMESLVKGFKTWTIIRLGNITWGTNPHTLINHFREQQRRGEKLTIKNVYRYIVDREEFDHWMDMIPNWSCEMSVVGRRMLVKDVFKEYVYGK